MFGLEKPFEKWGNYPNDLQRLLKLFHDAKSSGLFVISGDVHYAQALALPPPCSSTGIPYLNFMFLFFVSVAERCSPFLCSSPGIPLSCVFTCCDLSFLSFLLFSYLSINDRAFTTSPPLGYPLYEFISSGMAHDCKTDSPPNSCFNLPLSFYDSKVPWQTITYLLSLLFFSFLF